MSKHVAMPKPPDDEPVYLTIVHPYPLNANLELPADRCKLALWLGCCTRDPDVLLAMFHNPTLPGTVIIEVDQKFGGFEDLLGMHSWSTFLLNPTPDELDMTSKVFYYTGRLVENNDWERVSIEEHWFQGWAPNNSRIKYPYPRTTYCDVHHVPPGSQSMCRPLPTGAFPVQPLPPPPTRVLAPPPTPTRGVSAPSPTRVLAPPLTPTRGVSAPSSTRVSAPSPTRVSALPPTRVSPPPPTSMGLHPLSLILGACLLIGIGMVIN